MACYLAAVFLASLLELVEATFVIGIEATILRAGNLVLGIPAAPCNALEGSLEGGALVTVGDALQPAFDLFAWCLVTRLFGRLRFRGANSGEGVLLTEPVAIPGFPFIGRDAFIRRILYTRNPDARFLNARRIGRVSRRLLRSAL